MRTGGGGSVYLTATAFSSDADTGVVLDAYTRAHTLHNNANYGAEFATEPVALALLAASNAQPLAAAQQSGALVSPSFVIDVQDARNQTVATAALPVSINPASAFAGATTVLSDGGRAVFSDLVMHLPANASVLVWFSCTTAPGQFVAQVLDNIFTILQAQR